MQHQKAKHYKCRHCPRKLNTAGGLAVHVQQVHKLDPDKIDNAMPGRDGGEVEIFGMEGVPKSDLEAWRRKKEQEAGLAVGSTSQPATKRPRLDKKVISEQELAIQLAAHRVLMGGDLNRPAGMSGATASGAPTVYAAPQTYAVPPPGAAPAGGAAPFPGMPPPGALPPG
ncbi:hypothetical protein DL93DRAFT_304898 [Clavulina sp. PMI_390]|nr:hypothetical protein DL93DRAFT_304898 [Clavulina sp. PMI_390]